MTGSAVIPAKQDAEPTWPHPPRYGWLRRLVLGSLGIAVAFAVVRAGWGHEARRRLDRELGPILALGEPVAAPSLNPDPVPDAENGALVYLKAMNAIGTDSPASSAMEYSGPPFPPRWHKMADKSVATNGETLRLVREARRYTRFDWGVRVKTPAHAVAIGHLNSTRHLANVVSDAAFHAHVHGDDAEALERVRDVFHAAVAIDAAPNFLISHLVSTGLRAIALDRVMTIAPGLTIAPEGEEAAAPSDGTTRPARRPARRAQVRALIAELLDEREQLRDVRTAYVAERAAQLDMAGWFGTKSRLLRPMFDLDAVRLVRGNNALVAATQLPNSQALKDSVGAEPLIQQKPQSPALVAPGGPKPKAILSAKNPPIDYTRLLSTDISGGGMWRGIEQDIRVRTERRMAAVSLAVQLYRADHAGQFPPSLDALVPKYLPAVPVDPAAGDGRKLNYLVLRGALPGGGDRPLVYSVGADGVDDTAATDPTRAGLPGRPEYGYARGRDQWRDLSRWTAPRTATDEAEEARQEKMAEPILDALERR